MADNPNTVGGIRAVELYFRIIREISSGQPAFFQSRTQLNTPGLGTLMPENFRDVAEMSEQCIDLFMLELNQACESIIRFEERELNFNWISLHMPAQFLVMENAENQLMAALKSTDVSPNRLCFSFTDGILGESNDTAASRIQNLRNRGFHFMITNFGSYGCPVMRLADYPVDYIMLSPEVTGYCGHSQRSQDAVRSIVSFVDDMGAQAIADGVTVSSQASDMYDCGCLYCAGSLAGKYTAGRYIRKKTEN